MSVQHESPSAKAQRAYKAGEQTVFIIEKIEVVLDATPSVHDWFDRTGAFMSPLFWDKLGSTYPVYASVRDAMIHSTFTGSDGYGEHFNEADCPIGGIHWYVSDFGQAAIDMGPMGLITVSDHTDNRFATGIGFVPRDSISLPWLGWSLDYGGSEMLVPEPVVMRDLGPR